MSPPPYLITYSLGDTYSCTYYSLIYSLTSSVTTASLDTPLVRCSLRALMVVLRGVQSALPTSSSQACTACE